MHDFHLDTCGLVSGKEPGCELVVQQMLRWQMFKSGQCLTSDGCSEPWHVMTYVAKKVLN